MSPYISVFAAYLVLGAALFVIYRWWFQHLVNLAARYDLPERRKIAGRHFILLAPGVGLLFVTTVT